MIAKKRHSPKAVNEIVNVFDDKRMVATFSSSDEDFIDFLVKACDDAGYQTTKVPRDKEHGPEHK